MSVAGSVGNWPKSTISLHLSSLSLSCLRTQASLGALEAFFFSLVQNPCAVTVIVEALSQVTNHVPLVLLLLQGLWLQAQVG